MKRILINATHNEEIRVALCKDNHLYDFDLENRTREQKKANIYKGHVTRVEPSLEAVFVEYGSARQGFLPLREIAPEYLDGNAREDNIKKLIKEGDELIIQVEKEERGNKGAALSTYISLAGRYLVLMPNNAKGGGISRQISGKVRDEIKQIIASLAIPRGMSVIVRTAGIGKTYEDLQTDLDHLLDIWTSIQKQNRERKSPCLVHQEAGVVTRAVRDYLRDDIGEIWIDSEHAYNEAASFIAAVMPNQMKKLRKYTDYEPMFAAFGIERQIESAYQREVRLPSGGSIVIDQTEAMVAIDINSSKSTKGSDVAETAYHTNLEAADEIARQLRLRDMGGLIVIDFIDMNEAHHQKEVEKRLIEATRYDRARVQFAEISKFGLMEMSRQRLRPSLEESTGYICPRCHGNGMIRDLRSLALSIMRQIEQIALKQRSGEIQAEVPTEIAAFLLNEKREALVYLEQDSGTRITVLPHAHLESPNFSLHFNPDGFAPSSYDRIVNVEAQQHVDRGYDVNWQTEPKDVKTTDNHWQQSQNHPQPQERNQKGNKAIANKIDVSTPVETAPRQAVAWLSNLFAPKPEAKLAGSLSNQGAAAAIEAIVNTGAQSLGALGTLSPSINNDTPKKISTRRPEKRPDNERSDKQERTPRQDKRSGNNDNKDIQGRSQAHANTRQNTQNSEEKYPKRENNSRREPRAVIERLETLTPTANTLKDNRAAVPEKEKSQKNKKSEVKSPSLGVHAIAVPDTTNADDPPKTVHLSLDTSKDTSTRYKNDGSAADVTIPADTALTTEVHVQATTVADAVPETTETTEHRPTQTAQPIAASSESNDTKASSNDNHAVDDAQLMRVAATQGRAKNDPRVVKAAWQNAKPAVTAVTAAITGKAGDFIYSALDDADTYLTTHGFAATFIAALNTVRAMNTAVSTADAVFDFSNYGYAPIHADVLAEFYHGISSTNSHTIAQGKSEVTAGPHAPRAKNDPRGQHPKHLLNNLVEPASVVTTTPQSQASSTETEAVTDIVSTDTADSGIKIDDSETHNDLSQSLNTALEEVLDAVGDKLAQAVEVAQDAWQYIIQETASDNQAAPHADTADNTPVVAADDASDDISIQTDGTESPSANDKEQVVNKKSATKNSKDKKAKATNYKNMIENVAEQLLPQTGLLNLATPKPAKVRIKKPKAEGSNKPKAEVRKKPKSNDNMSAQQSNEPTPDNTPQS